MRPLSTHPEELRRRIELRGKAVLDIGAGDGTFARALAAAGAAPVTALEIEEEKVRRMAAGAGGAVVPLQGVAGALPLPDASQDLVCFLFSFHHVPGEQQPAALDEAHRVLRPGGRLHAVDPLAEGPITEVLKPVEDETLVRTQAQARLAALDGERFALLERAEYSIRRVYASPEDVIDRLIQVDPARAARLPQARALVERRIAELAEPDPAGLALTQPCVLFHFRRS